MKFVFFGEVREYCRFIGLYFKTRVLHTLSRFESRKDRLVGKLTTQRGKFVRPFIHSGVIGLVFVGVTLGPTILAKSAQGQNQDNGVGGAEPFQMVLGESTSSDYGPVGFTQISDKPPSEVREYAVQSGDTVSDIAKKFGVSDDTIYWENNLTQKSTLKPGQTVRVLPVSGVKHIVSRGETVHSIADKYDVSAQAIVDWPYNSFTNDETFGLAVGQTLIIPDGVKPEEKPVSPRQFIAHQTPDAGTVAASGEWVWPTQGRITQQFSWYHPGIDIANRDLPSVVAADSGRVMLVKSDTFGYGNHIVIDHGNGYQTLYGHLSAFRVEEGQTVQKGSVIGIMGSTGRSTGPHLHFEIRTGSGRVNPLDQLK